MKVLLDTNIIVSDFNFKKPAAIILLEHAKIGKLDVYIPEVVVDEVVNKFRQRIEHAEKVILSELGKISSLNDEPLEELLIKESVTVSVAKYQHRLRAMFDEHKIVILPYPNTSHRFLAKKAMLKKKPFNTNEKGYRDNLIWENIKSLISNLDEGIVANPEFIFVTDNHTDFMSGDGLHNDLIVELEDQGLQTERVAVYRSLHDFSDRVMKMYLTQENILKDRLCDIKFGDSALRRSLIKYLYEEYLGQDLGDFEFAAPGDYNENGDREITGFNEDFEVLDLEVKKLSVNEFVVDLRISIETELELFVDKSDHYSSSEGGYSVIDYDWNNHVMLVSESQTVPFAITLIVNSKLECQSIEMNIIEDCQGK